MKVGPKCSKNNQENNPEKPFTRKVDDEQTACGYSISTQYLFNATETKKMVIKQVRTVGKLFLNI